MKKTSQQRQSTSALGSECPPNIWGIARGKIGLLPGHCNPGATQAYPALGLLANGTLQNIDLYRQLGELLGQNRTKIELKIVSK